MAQNGREPRREANRILAMLPADSRDRLVPHLEPIELERGQVLHAAGTAIEHIYFIEQGLVSLVKTMSDGSVVEVGTIGIEGMVGLSALIGIARVLVDVVVQAPGSALRVRPSVLAEEMALSRRLHDLVLRYGHALLLQFIQTAACNSLHSIEERCCRWLLIAHDSARTDTFPLTHEFLAMLLGVQRAGVSVAAGALQKAGIIEYHYGRVTIVDRRGLEARACECYEAIRASFDRLLDA
ncbi:MAG TPA: Crp/Fnr family transcriptional regulator [Stellaceae bacterium]|nr:Crp/Fnr family transcriptional regulator [Stellaceae bacterium]